MNEPELYNFIDSEEPPSYEEITMNKKIEVVISDIKRITGNISESIDEEYEMMNTFDKLRFFINAGLFDNSIEEIENHTSDNVVKELFNHDDNILFLNFQLLVTKFLRLCEMYYRFVDEKSNYKKIYNVEKSREIILQIIIIQNIIRLKFFNLIFIN